MPLAARAVPAAGRCPYGINSCVESLRGGGARCCLLRCSCRLGRTVRVRVTGHNQVAPRRIPGHKSRSKWNKEIKRLDAYGGKEEGEGEKRRERDGRMGGKEPGERKSECEKVVIGEIERDREDEGWKGREWAWEGE